MSRRNKSLFASFSSEKEDSSFFEKKEAKKLPAYQPSGTGLYNALFECMIR
jgi:hypothetical protein